MAPSGFLNLSFLGIVILNGFNVNTAGTYEKCGTNLKIDGETRFIVQDPEASNPPGTWPWVVSMGKKTGESSWLHICGGAIITPKIVITAAHCPYENARDIRLGKLKIRAGDDNLQDINDNELVQDRWISDFKLHPRYQISAKTSYYDVALLILSRPLEMSKAVRTICLPSQDTMRVDDDDISLIVTAWGKDINNQFGNNLAETKVQVYPEEYCNATHIGQKNADIAVPNGFSDDLFCGGDSVHNEGVCYGDSGSPAVKYEPYNKRYLLKGLVSGGVACGTEHFANIYLRLSNVDVLTWIKNEIKELALTETADGEVRCVTVGGSDTGASCVFPFAYNDKTFTVCTLEGAQDGIPWCSTQVDDRGFSLRGKWGHCGLGCPTDSGDSVIFIVGGYPISSVGKTTEVLDLDTSSSCTRYTPDIPEVRDSHTVNYVDGVVIVCGGGDYSSSTQQSCISSRSPSIPWLPHSTTKAKRRGHSSVFAAGHLHLLGGAYSESEATMETLEGDTWTLHDLPYKVSVGSCSVQTAHNQFVLTGGSLSSKKMSKWSEGNVWEFLPDLTVGRYRHGCTSVTMSGVVHVVVAGGRDFSDNDLSSSSIYNMDTRRWTDMGNMEVARVYGVLINLRYGEVHRVIMLGGQDSDYNELSTVEELELDQDNVDKSAWKLLSITMKKAKYDFGAVAVPKSIFC